MRCRSYGIASASLTDYLQKLKEIESQRIYDLSLKSLDLLTLNEEKKQMDEDEDDKDEYDNLGAASKYKCNHIFSLHKKRKLSHHNKYIMKKIKMKLNKKRIRLAHFIRKEE